jgi:hypothetical protein
MDCRLGGHPYRSSNDYTTAPGHDHILHDWYSFLAAAVNAKGAALARYKRLARAPRANTDMGIAQISEVPYGEEGPEHAGR